MNLNRNSKADIPVDTFQAARQIYNHQHLYLQIGDQFHQIFADTDLHLLDPYDSSNEEAILRVSLVTAFQYAEFIPDTVAADASRKRLDWKYALHLPVHHQGVSSYALCAFRKDLYASPRAQQEFDRLIEGLRHHGLYAADPKTGVSCVTVLATVCQINRMHLLYTGMKGAIVSLVAHAPDWLVNTMPPYWYSRYKSSSRLQLTAANKTELEAEAAKLGTDIHILVSALRKQNLSHLLKLAEIRHIMGLFSEQFLIVDDQIQWRQPDCLSASGARRIRCGCDNDLLERSET